MLTPTIRVSMTFLSISPGIVSLIILCNLRLLVVEWNPFLLSKSGGSSWGESSSIIGNPVNMISSGGVGLSTPGNLVGLVVLSIIP
jgi:hypothetical protein